MKKLTVGFYIIMAILLLSGCAASYRPIQPNFILYQNEEVYEGLEFSYKYDVLRERSNPKYTRKEFQTGVKIVAVKIKNLTDSIIHVGRDVEFYSSGKIIQPLDPVFLKSIFEQNTAVYLAYLTLALLQLEVQDESSVKTYPVGLFLGPLLTLINTVAAIKANNDFFDEIKKFDINTSKVAPGDIVWAIAGFAKVGYNPISVKIKDHTEPIPVSKNP